jgi:uncharacterized protein
MVRPIKPRCLRGNPRISYFKPQGVPLRSLGEVVLNADEFEAIRLHDSDNLNQTDAAKEMQISQPTFARILNRTYKKIAQALVEGYAIKIDTEGVLTMENRPKRDGRGPFRDGRGPNPDCPLKKGNSDSTETISNDGRKLKRDGTGPNKDGKGPRESDLGPKEYCPKN